MGPPQLRIGEPLPILHRADGSVVALPDDALPLLPPELENYKPAATGEPPLARAPQWVRTTDPATGAPALRENQSKFATPVSAHLCHCLAAARRQCYVRSCWG